MSEHIDHIPTAADAETDSFEDEVTPEALNLSASLFWILALGCLAILPWAVEKGRRDLGWFQEPWSWPFIVLWVAIIGGAIHVLRLWHLSKGATFSVNARSAFDGMERSFIYSGTFLIYLGGVAMLGFTLASLLFMQALYWISGLRGGKWPLVAFLVTVVIVLVFRVGLDIWFPMPPILQLLPDWVAGTIGVYL